LWPHLDEANVVGVLPEALAADVQVVLADDTTLVAAHAAAGQSNASKHHGSSKTGISTVKRS
jgi:hypothetical protein